MVIVCVAVSLVLVVALVLCRRRAPSRTGEPVDYGTIAGTQLFDAELAPVPPSQRAAAADTEPS